MQNFEVFHVDSLRPGQIIFEDIFVENRRLLTKGNSLTERIISILKNRNIKHIKIEKAVQEDEPIPIDFNQNETLLEEMESFSFDFNAAYELGDTELLNLNFLDALGTLSSEMRYGKALNNADDIEILKGLFTDYLENSKVYKYLSDLKIHDESAYMHSVDVFTLGTLFALSEGVSNIKDAALGYLLHDVDKSFVEESQLEKFDCLAHNESPLIQDQTQYGEEISQELQILRLIDTYSAITIVRAYKVATPSVNAIEKIFKQISQIDANLVYRFVEFLGIYPENSVVLLSDGNHAIVEKVDTLQPLLSSIKIVQTHETFKIPINFNLKIVKLLSYYVNTPNEMFSKFSDSLINNDERSMIRYYEKLKDHYSENEWFTHIYLPFFSIFKVIEINHILTEKRISDIFRLVFPLIDNTLKQFKLSHPSNEKVIILFDGETPKPIHRMFEGFLHSNNFYPFISPNTPAKETLEKTISICKAKQVIVVGESFNHLQFPSIDYYHLTEAQLEGLLSRFIYSDIQQFQLWHELERYRLNNTNQTEIYHSNLFSIEQSNLFN